jgi:hypothetical protein
VSDRSDELRRQREIVRQHLAWLDRELTAQEGIPAAEPEPVLLPPQRFSVEASDADRDAESILAEFRRPAPAIEAQAKKGCILYFSIAVVLMLAAAMITLYMYSRARR